MSYLIREKANCKGKRDCQENERKKYGKELNFLEIHYCIWKEREETRREEESIVRTEGESFTSSCSISLGISRK